ncbi:aspartyl protease family protein [Nannocystaceae bacterium ST9]
MPVTPRTRRVRLFASGLLTATLALSGCLKVPTDLDEPEGGTTAPTTAQELLDRHIAASGGAEALRKLAARTVEARVVFKAQEGCEEGDEDCMWEDSEGQFVLYTTADARMYRRMVVGENVLERGFDGENGWQLQANPQVLVMEDPATKPLLREDALLHWYFDVDQRGLALELLPSRDAEDGRKLDGVRWFAASEDWPESEKWFDRATGLLYEEIERDTETGDMVRRIYGDYTEVDGVQVPWLIQQITMADGLAVQTIELHVQAVNHRPIEAEKFAVPTLPPVEPETDELLTMLEQARAAAAAEPKLLDAHVKLARIAFAAAHFEEARSASRAALKLDNKDLEALYTLVRVDLLEGDLKSAESNLGKAIAVGLRDDEAARQKAWIHLRRGQWDKAAEDLAKAGNQQLGDRYAAFDGRPFAAKMGGDGCKTTLPIKLDQGAVVFEVGADGDKLRLLLDTGASDVIITDAKAKSLVIGTDATAPLSAGGPPLPQGQLDKLTIGELEVENVPVSMFPADQLGLVVGLDGVDGILGIRPFAGRQLTIDLERDVMEIVEPSKRCGKQLEANRGGQAVPFWLHETHYMYVLGHMRDAEGVYLVNTGMRGADLTANEGAYAFAGIGAPALYADQTAALAQIDRFRLGPWAREDLVAAWGFLAQNATSDGFRLDGMIGLGVLGEGSWTIDFEQQKFFLRAPSKPKAEPKPKQAEPKKAEPDPKKPEPKKTP